MPVPAAKSVPNDQAPSPRGTGSRAAFAPRRSARRSSRSPGGRPGPPTPDGACVLRGGEEEDDADAPALAAGPDVEAGHVRLAVGHPGQHEAAVTSAAALRLGVYAWRIAVRTSTRERCGATDGSDGRPLRGVASWPTELRPARDLSDLLGRQRGVVEIAPVTGLGVPGRHQAPPDRVGHGHSIPAGYVVPGQGEGRDAALVVAARAAPVEDRLDAQYVGRTGEAPVPSPRAEKPTMRTAPRLTASRTTARRIGSQRSAGLTRSRSSRERLVPAALFGRVERPVGDAQERRRGFRPQGSWRRPARP